MDQTKEGMNMSAAVLRGAYGEFDWRKTRGELEGGGFPAVRDLFVVSLGIWRDPRSAQTGHQRFVDVYIV